METNEQVPAESTAVEETQEQTTGSEANVSEDGKTSAEDHGQGDLRVPLRLEREKRQRLEQAVNDPNFIYEQAKKLGLAGEDSEPETKVPSNPQLDVASEVRRTVRIEKALDKYPTLATDDRLQLMVTALINSGIDPVEAADEVFGRMTRAAENAKTETAKQAQQEVAAKASASMVSNTVRTGPATTDLADVERRMKSPDKKTQTEATVEWLKTQF